MCNVRYHERCFKTVGCTYISRQLLLFLSFSFAEILLKLICSRVDKLDVMKNYNYQIFCQFEIYFQLIVNESKTKIRIRLLRTVRALDIDGLEF